MTVPLTFCSTKFWQKSQKIDKICKFDMFSAISGSLPLAIQVAVALASEACARGEPWVNTVGGGRLRGAMRVQGGSVHQQGRPHPFFIGFI